MRALVYEGPERLEWREVPDPEPREGEALVRVRSVGICGSDMHAFLGHDERRPAPLILGHEAAGTVAGGAREGARVTVNPLVGCGRCPACTSGRANLCPSRQILSMPPREGAFAGLVAVPEANLVDVPDDVSFDRAALAEPLACGWHAVRLAVRHDADALRGGACVVIGGGAIGLGAALALRAHGAKRVAVAEPNAARRESVARAGFEAFDPAAPGPTAPGPARPGPVADGTASVVIDGVGYAATRAHACQLAAPGGIILHIGLGSAEGGIDVRRLTLAEITFTGTYTYTPDDFRETARAIFDGRLGALDWVEARPLRDGARAFADIRAGRAAAPKIILKPEGED